MAKINLKVSSDTYNEIAQRLGEQGIQLKPDQEYTIGKDIAIERPYNMLHVGLRKDVVTEAAKVYKTPVNEGDYEVSDSKHFINFADDVFKYILTGEKPTEETPTKAKSAPKKTGW